MYCIHFAHTHYHVPNSIMPASDKTTILTSLKLAATYDREKMGKGRFITSTLHTYIVHYSMCKDRELLRSEIFMTLSYQQFVMCMKLIRNLEVCGTVGK